jgi:hypothetical protein
MPSDRKTPPAMRRMIKTDRGAVSGGVSRKSMSRCSGFMPMATADRVFGSARPRPSLGGRGARGASPKIACNDPAGRVVPRIASIRKETHDAKGTLAAGHSGRRLQLDERGGTFVRKCPGRVGPSRRRIESNVDVIHLL